MKYDSAEWQTERDRKLYEMFNGDIQAISFLLMVFDIGETWDDLIDKDKEVSPEQVHRAFWQSIVGLPANPFFQTHQATLLPILAVGMNAYMDSVEMEKGDEQDRAMVYGLRDLYLEVIPAALALSQGYDAMRAHSKDIRRWLVESHESFSDYMKGEAK